MCSASLQRQPQRAAAALKPLVGGAAQHALARRAQLPAGPALLRLNEATLMAAEGVAPKSTGPDNSLTPHHNWAGVSMQLFRFPAKQRPRSARPGPLLPTLQEAPLSPGPLSRPPCAATGHTPAATPPSSQAPRPAPPQLHLLQQRPLGHPPPLHCTAWSLAPRAAARAQGVEGVLEGQLRRAHR